MRLFFQVGRECRSRTFEQPFSHHRRGDLPPQYRIAHGLLFGAVGLLLRPVGGLLRIPCRPLPIRNEPVPGILHGVREAHAAGCGDFEIRRTPGRFHGRYDGLVVVGYGLDLPVPINAGYGLFLSGKIYREADPGSTGKWHYHHAQGTHRILSIQGHHTGGYVMRSRCAGPHFTALDNAGTVFREKGIYRLQRLLLQPDQIITEVFTDSCLLYLSFHNFN